MFPLRTITILYQIHAVRNNVTHKYDNIATLVLRVNNFTPQLNTSSLSLIVAHKQSLKLFTLPNLNHQNEFRVFDKKHQKK